MSDEVPVHIHRTDGRVELRVAPRARLFESIRPWIRAETLEPLNLNDGTVMLVDEDAWVRKSRPPVNHYATDRWFAIVGASHAPIIGDVAIVALADLR